MPRCLHLLASAVCLLPFARAEPPPTAPLEEAWRLLAEYRFAEANEAFQQRPAPADRTAALGRALALLNHPPVS